MADALERVRGLLDRAEAAGVDALSPRMIRKHLDDPATADRTDDPYSEAMAELTRHRAAVTNLREAAEKIERAESLAVAKVLGARIRDVLATLDG